MTAVIITTTSKLRPPNNEDFLCSIIIQQLLYPSLEDCAECESSQSQFEASALELLCMLMHGCLQLPPFGSAQRGMDVRIIVEVPFKIALCDMRRDSSPLPWIHRLDILWIPPIAATIPQCV